MHRLIPSARATNRLSRAAIPMAATLVRLCLRCSGSSVLPDGTYFEADYRIYTSAAEARADLTGQGSASGASTVTIASAVVLIAAVVVAQLA